MTTAVEAMAGLWWKFDSYEIRDGYLKPTRGAKLSRYNPWDVGSRSLPVVELVDLSRAIMEASERGGHTFHTRLPEEWQRRLCTWCESYGLLGILPESLLSVDLPPQWERDPVSRRLKQLEYFVPSQTSYLGTPSGWQSTTTFLHAAASTKRKRPSSRQVDQRVAAKHGLRQQAAFYHSGRIRLMPLETLGQFFPRVPLKRVNAFRYPMPLSPDFWHLYAEPVQLFLQRASQLRRIYSDLDHPEPAERDLARNELNRLICKVHPFVYGDRKRFQMEWISTSLTTTLAMMLAQKLMGGFRFFFCAAPGCGRAFVSRQYQVKYCGKTCRWRDQKRREKLALGPPAR